MPVGGHVKGQKRALSLSLRGAGFATKQSPMRRWGLLRHTTPRNDRGKFLSSVFCKAIPKLALWRLLCRHKTPPRNDRVSSHPSLYENLSPQLSGKNFCLLSLHDFRRHGKIVRAAVDVLGRTRYNGERTEDERQRIFEERFAMARDDPSAIANQQLKVSALVQGDQCSKI